MVSSARESADSRANGLADAEFGQVRGLGGQGEGFDEHEAGQVGRHAVEGAGAELREGVVAAVGGDDVVPGLRAAVEADDGADLVLRWLRPPIRLAGCTAAVGVSGEQSQSTVEPLPASP